MTDRSWSEILGKNGSEGDPMELAGALETLIAALFDHREKRSRRGQPVDLTPVDFSKSLLEHRRKSWVVNPIERALGDGIKSVGRVAYEIGGDDALHELAALTEERIERRFGRAEAAGAIINSRFDGIGCWVA